MNYTETLSHFIANSTMQDFPEEVVDASKKCLLDWIGVTLGGMKDPSVRLLVHFIEEMGGRRQASILGYGTKTNLLYAALANGMMSHVLDFDDAHSGVRTHPSAPLIPALLSIAEYRGLSGSDLITAFVVGFEITIRVGFALGREYYDAGWHATSVLGRFGAAAGVGRLLNLNVRQLCNAFGLAATQAGGVRDVFGTMAKPFHAGKAAMDGALSALLAQRGFRAPEDILSQNSGFPALFSSEYNPNRLTIDLGKSYHILGDSFKPYAACLLAHPVIDGMVILKEECDIDNNMVEKIDLEVSPMAMKVAGSMKPKDGMEGKFSLHFVAALALIYGGAGNSLFTDETVRDPGIKRLMRKVKASSKASLGETEARVTITMKDGTRYARRISTPKGDPGNPLTFEEIVGKFRDLTAEVLSAEGASHIIETVRNLDKLKTSAKLVKLCRAQTGIDTAIPVMKK